MVRKSIFREYLLFFVIVGFIPLLVSELIMFTIYKNDTIQYVNNNASVMFNYVLANVESAAGKYYDIINSSTGLGSEPNVTSVLLEKNTGTNNSAELEALADNLLKADNFTKGVVIIDKNLNMTGVSRIDGVLNEDYNCKYITYVNDIFENKTELSFFPTHRVDYYNDDTQVVTFAKAVLYSDKATDETEVLGVILIDVYINMIGVFFQNVDRDVLRMLYLVDEEGYCIYSLNESWPGRRIYEFADYGDNQIEAVDNENRYFISSALSTFRWKLIGGINESNYISKVNTVRNLTIAVIMLGILICVSLAFVGSSAFLRPINHIVTQMHAAKEGNLDARVNLTLKNELGQIGDSFNIMMESLQATIQKVYVSQIKQKDAELAALKAQIQPHYLYNTLEVIRMTALENNDEKVAEMVKSLSYQFRYLIEGGNDAVSVRQELELIEMYFNIIKVRFGGKISLEMLVDEDVKEIKIPKLTLQPLVENAVSHGLKAKGGKILIKGYARDEHLVLEVNDNGVGMTATRLAEIRAALFAEDSNLSATQESTGIALRNIYQRLDAFFCGGFDISITSLEMVGTSVRISVKGGC